MTGDEVLAVRARRALYEFVRASPGYHLREIARSTNLSITLADYHLRFLERHELVSSAMDGLVVAVSSVLGLIVGSFLNVLVHRVPLHLSIVTPRSRCPGCEAPIAPAPGSASTVARFQ